MLCKAMSSGVCSDIIPGRGNVDIKTVQRHEQEQLEKRIAEETGEVEKRKCTPIEYLLLFGQAPKLDQVQVITLDDLTAEDARHKHGFYSKGYTCGGCRYYLPDKLKCIGLSAIEAGIVTEGIKLDAETPACGWFWEKWAKGPGDPDDDGLAIGPDQYKYQFEDNDAGRKRWEKRSQQAYGVDTLFEQPAAGDEEKSIGELAHESQMDVYEEDPEPEPPAATTVGQGAQLVPIEQLYPMLLPRRNCR